MKRVPERKNEQPQGKGMYKGRMTRGVRGKMRQCMCKRATGRCNSRTKCFTLPPHASVSLSVNTGSHSDLSHQQDGLGASGKEKLNGDVGWWGLCTLVRKWLSLG